MRKNNVVKLLGIALVVAIISTGLFYGLFVNKLSSNAGTGNTMVVAAKPLKAGTVLAASDVKTIPWPAAELPKGNYGKCGRRAGVYCIQTALAKGSLYWESRLVSAKSAGGAGVPSGMRAVSVHVTDSTGVLGLLRGGQMVDVQVVRGKLPDVSVRTALENLRVLSVMPQSELTSQGVNLPVVTLLATPQDADVLAAADAGGRVRLTLRNSLDAQTRSRSAITLDGVMKTTGAASGAEPAAIATGGSAKHP